MQLEITATRHVLAARSPAGWWLTVAWRFRNAEARPLHLLSDGPIWILDADPIVLNHAIDESVLSIDPYTDPELAFTVLDAGTATDLERAYPLPPTDLRHPRSAVGRFAVGMDPPDPSWRRGQAWETVMKWQRVVQSSALQVTAPG